MESPSENGGKLRLQLKGFLEYEEGLSRLIIFLFKAVGSGLKGLTEDEISFCLSLSSSLLARKPAFSPWTLPPLCFGINHLPRSLFVIKEANPGPASLAV